MTVLLFMLLKLDKKIVSCMRSDAISIANLCRCFQIIRFLPARLLRLRVVEVCPTIWCFVLRPCGFLYVNHAHDTINIQVCTMQDCSTIAHRFHHVNDHSYLLCQFRRWILLRRTCRRCNCVQHSCKRTGCNK